MTLLPQCYLKSLSEILAQWSKHSLKMNLVLKLELCHRQGKWPLKVSASYKYGDMKTDLRNFL
jgi:hypothetical protein